ncbi:MAG: YdcF family protein [bacterium]
MRKKGCLLFLLVLFIALLFFFIFRAPLLLAMGRYLAVQDELKKSDVIVVLAGERGERVVQAVSLYRDGWAPLILMSGGPGEAGIPLSEIMKFQAVKLGVPAKAVLQESRSLDTGEDALFSREILEKMPVRSLILVTSPYHARRAADIFRRVFKDSGMEILIYPVQKSWFKLNDWWTRKLDAKCILMEYMKIIWYRLVGAKAGWKGGR